MIYIYIYIYYIYIHICAKNRVLHLFPLGTPPSIINKKTISFRGLLDEVESDWNPWHYPYQIGQHRNKSANLEVDGVPQRRKKRTHQDVLRSRFFEHRKWCIYCRLCIYMFFLTISPNLQLRSNQCWSHWFQQTCVPGGCLQCRKPDGCFPKFQPHLKAQNRASQENTIEL